MKKIILVTLALMSYAYVKAQSANLDRERFSVSYVLLPTNPILEDKERTYEVNVINALRSSSRRKITKSKINIAGFSKLDENASLSISIDISDIELGDVTIKKTEKENKDKDGKVTSITRTYNAVVPYKTYATMDISNAIDGTSKTERYSNDETYTSDSFKTYSKAKEYYNNNRANLKDRFRNDFFNGVIGSMNYHLNKKYGYRKSNSDTEIFWILASKKHPEFAKHQEMYQTLKAAFAQMKSDIPTDEIATQVTPAIDYFNSVVAKYPGKDRKSKKVRYASYYNIAKIYYYLDNPDKAIEYSEKLIENDYDKGDGKSMIKKSESLKKSFEINKMTSRHFEIVSEDLTNKNAVEDEDLEAEDFEIEKEDKEMVAFLITAKNDTITAKIKESDLENIGQNVKITTIGTKEGSKEKTGLYKAKNFTTLALTNGDFYDVVKFKESSTKDGDAVDVSQLALGGASPKFVKVLHKSDNIELFLFAGKEIVIKKPADDKGKSTLSTGYMFGFKKKLAGLVKDCPELAERAMAKEFENTTDSLLKFCEAYDACK